MILTDEPVQRAVQELQRRAERVVDPTKLHDIYVDNGILNELSLGSNQVIHGRRGVGKTHLLHFYRDHLARTNPGILYQLHDCTRLGSGFASDPDAPQSIATRAFNQLLNDIATSGFDEIDRITALDSTIKHSNPAASIMKFQDVASLGGEGGAKFDFRNLGDTLDKYRTACNADFLVIALDEFVSIPLRAQPYFAECIRRAFFTKPRIVFRIAAVSYSSLLSTQHNDGVVGFEPAADAFGDVDLDKYFVWEEDNGRSEAFFGEVLYNHLAQDIGLSMIGVDAATKRQEMVRLFFTQESAFSELCRAAEGNCRDFLNVFRTTYFKYLRENSVSQRLAVPQVKQGAEEWFRTEKLRAISSERYLEEFLNHLIQNIIRKKRTKTFMVHYRDVNHPVLNRLYAARLLHPLRTVWKHPDQPGEPYHLVTMDYGCYVALKNTSSAPDDTLFYSHEERKYDDLVPLDDRRSIRRVVVERDVLDTFMPKEN